MAATAWPKGSVKVHTQSDDDIGEVLTALPGRCGIAGHFKLVG